MQKLTIKKESLPLRCDICHQADLFDDFSNRCQRCQNINLTIDHLKPSQTVDNKKEATPDKKELSISHLSYNTSEIIFFSSMILAITLFIFFPEQTIIRKENIKYFVFGIGMAMAGYNYAFGGKEGQARTMRIAVMVVVFSLWEFFIKFMREIN